jgi:membrane fusion protein (multidrug efflux system)
MNEKQNADKGELRSTEARSTNEADVSVEPGKKLAQTDPVSKSVPPRDRRSAWRRKLFMGGLGALVLAAVAAFSIPRIQLALNTVSTDDAYVNSHVTFVATRVTGQVSRVLVDDNDRVHKGDILVELDKEPFQDAVAVKKAVVDTAQADLQAAHAMVGSIEAQARSRRWNLQNAMQDVENKIALLHARVAALNKSKASLALAQAEFDRAKQLIATATMSREEYDRRQAALSTAQAGVTQALADVNQTRVSFGADGTTRGGRRSRPSSTRSRSDFFFCPPGASRPDPERSSAWRCPLIQPDAEADARAVRKTGP